MKKVNWRLFFGSLLVVLTLVQTASAADEVPDRELNMDRPYATRISETLTVQGKDIPWEHEINVVLPASYALNPDADYPVLWVTDGAFYLNLIPGIVNVFNTYNLLPELIIVTVGLPSDHSVGQFGQQRFFDFVPNTPGLCWI